MGPYYSNVCNWDRALTVVVFVIIAKKNYKCVIIIITNIYKIIINNPNIQLLIQWNISRLLDLIIQYMKLVGEKSGQLIFTLFVPKWLAIKDLKEIKDWKAKKDGIIKPNKNSATQQASPLYQVSNALQKDEGSNSKLVVRLIAGFVTCSKAKVFDIKDTDLFADFFYYKCR